MNFGLIKYLADEVDRTLHLVGVPSFLVFDDDSSADDVRSSGDVDQKSFIWSWRSRDRGPC